MLMAEPPAEDNPTVTAAWHDTAYRNVCTHARVVGAHVKTGAVARGHVHVAPLFGIGRRAQRQDVGVHTVCAEAPGVTRQVRLGIYRFDAAPLARYSERCRPNEPHIVELGRANAVGHHTRFAHGTWPRQLRRRSIDENGTLANALVGARALVRLIARQVDGPYLDGVPDSEEQRTEE
eukprot:scaffold81097_cov66-Phaeocystis_antarctica.AAC.3